VRLAEWSFHFAFFGRVHTSRWQIVREILERFSPRPAGGRPGARAVGRGAPRRATTRARDDRRLHTLFLFFRFFFFCIFLERVYICGR